MGSKRDGPKRLSVVAFVASGSCLIVLGILALLRESGTFSKTRVNEAAHHKLETELQARRRALYSRSNTPPAALPPAEPASYSWDKSWPIHNAFPEDEDYKRCDEIREKGTCAEDSFATSGSCGGSCSADVFHARYAQFIHGCYDKYEQFRCRQVDDQRMRMNVQQPQQQNHFTELGFTKVKVPPALWSKISHYWKTSPKKQKDEEWPPGNIYVNHWAAPTYMVNLEDSEEDAPGMTGKGLKRELWRHMQPVIEEWTGKRVRHTSLYGIRVYHEGAILASHCDRLPLVSSAIINVDQDVDEPWPLEIYDHAGRAHNVTMEPGEAVLYESHVCVHGRPFPLKGRYFANIFVHFEPVDRSNNKEPKHLRAEN